MTGASSGIGAATARAFAEAGARVVLLARGAEALERAAADARAAGGEAHAFPVDLADADAVAVTAAALVERVGSPHVLVNNAGRGRWLFMEETEPAELVEQIQVPYLAAFYLTRELLAGMVARGSGRIVTINSAASRLPFPGTSGYSCARWAMRGFAVVLRAELHGTGVGVTEVVAGKVASTYFVNNPGAEERIPRIARLVPTLTPEQVALAIVRGVRADAREVRVPRTLRLILAAHAIAPRLVERLVVATGPPRPPR